MTVYVAQPSAGKNLTPALAFGELVAVIDRQADPMFEAREILSRADKVLSKFCPSKDYLLMIGDPIVIGIVAAQLAKRVDSFRALKWDKLAGRYQTINVPCNTGKDR